MNILFSSIDLYYFEVFVRSIWFVHRVALDLTSDLSYVRVCVKSDRYCRYRMRCVIDPRLVPSPPFSSPSPPMLSWIQGHFSRG